MGLGKTVQAISLCACYRDEWPCLVIVPSSLKESWALALRMWLDIPEHQIKVVHKFNAQVGSVAQRCRGLPHVLADLHAVTNYGRPTRSGLESGF